MPRLMLRLGAHFVPDEGEVEWLVQGEDQAIVEHGRAAGGALAEAVAAHAPWANDPARVVVFVAAADVLLLSVRVPGRNAAQIRQAAPYAVEEFLTEDIDTMHVACGTVARGAPVECLVAPQADMATWLAALSHAGVVPGFMTSDAMAVEVASNAVTVLYDGDVALVRAPGEAACVDRANLPDVLDALRTSLGEEAVLRQIGGAMSDLELSRTGFAPEQVEAAERGQPLAYLAAFDKGSVANLLQGQFAARRQAGGAGAPWRAVAASAGAAGFLALALQAAQGVWANHRADALRTEATALFRDIYQVQRVPGNPATRMRFRLGQAPEGTAGFHRLVANLGVALKELPNRYDLIGLSYTERSGLGAEVVVSDYDTLERLQTALAARGLAFEVVAAEQFEQRVRANLRLDG